MVTTRSLALRTLIDGHALAARVADVVEGIRLPHDVRDLGHRSTPLTP